MEATKFIKSLTWSDASYALNEFLDTFGVPNLVCCSQEGGHYGMNDTCTFDNNQVLMLHALRTKHNLMAEDSDGRPISIPLKCENNLLRCPLSIYCKYDPIYVSQMSHVYPDIKYFRVLENHWSERMKYLKPESILEIEHIDSSNSAVKFRDIDQPLPLNCRVKYISLNIELVRFLPTPNANQEVDNEFENLVSNLGKVNVIHSAKPQTVVVATKINADSSGLAKTSVTDCLQIPKDYDLNVCVAKELLEKNPTYLNVVSELNQAFLDKYDLKELDNSHKCQYLDEPSGNIKTIVCSVLAAKVHERNNVAESLPRNSGNVKVPPALPPKPTSRSGRQITPPTCDQQSRKTETVRQYEICKDTNEKAQKVRQYDDVKVRCSREQYDDDIKPRWPTEEYAYKKDHHIYESISDNSNDDAYEYIDDGGYEDIDNDETSHDYVDMTSHDYVDMTLHDFVAMTSQGHVSMTSEEDQYYTMSRNENTSTSPRLERKGENLTETTKLEPARKCLVKLPFPADASTPRPDNKTSAETTRLETKLSPRLERKGENLTETTKLDPAKKCLVKLPFPAEASTPRPDNKTSTETTRLETKLSPRLERKSENLTETTKLEPAGKILVKLPFPADASTPRPDNKTSTETTRLETKLSPKLERKRENLTETTKLEPARKCLVKLPFPADASTPRPDNKTSTETTRLETKLSPRLERKSENLTETTKLEPAGKILVKLPFPEDASTPRPDNKTSTETTRLETKLSPRLERKGENLTETTKLEPARKYLLKFPFPVDPDNKTSSEITRSEPNYSEASDKSIKLKVDNKTSQKVSSPTDLSAQNLKPGSDNYAENITLEPVSKKLVPKTRTRSMVLSRKPAFAIPKDRYDLPVRKALCAIPIPTELSSLSVEGVRRLLTSLNMACYADNFQEEQVDGEILVELDETALKSLDLKPFHVKKMIKVIAGWRPNVGGNKD
ncbi:SH3 and multiple ankyrin repeat domains 2-like [Paramuricea clavata]|uniref:SH3 and multiple ankyrin repeat domains 2-like n=1 Tax=Paramuricea clavata TaxID=317549 RepID=A0A7D9HAL9_PARCT|nr:SH3 and multiple ankyrin repeat domains 2-like [Paramuricea clavata]